MSRAAFEARFPDDAACAAHLFARRRPDGFVCPACAGCGRQTSVTTGTAMHRSHLPLRTWFMAAHIVTSHY